MKDDTPEILKFQLNRKVPASPSEIKQEKKTPIDWVHLNYTIPNNRKWLLESSGLEETLCEAMLSKEARPRLIISKQGLLIILRTINYHPGAEPDDMLSVRIWIDEHKIITIARQKLKALDKLQEDLKNHIGPSSAFEFLDEITDKITDEISVYIAKIDEAINQLENESIDSSLRRKLSETRSQIIAVRRYLAPQRDALSRLTQVDRLPWLSEADRMHLMETTDRTIRCLEDLDEARERATIVQETISSKISEQVGQRMYLLSMVAAIFLPISFLTSLLGINVAGIPMAHARWAFLGVTLILCGIASVEYLVFKRKKWI